MQFQSVQLLPQGSPALPGVWGHERNDLVPDRADLRLGFLGQTRLLFGAVVFGNFERRGKGGLES